MNDTIKDAYDVVVVGGGAAGLSGALTLSRSRSAVLVIDAGEPRNAPAAGVHNFLSRDGIAPAELLHAGRAEVRGYGGQIVTGRVNGAARDGDGFIVMLDGGHSVQARRLLVTTGLMDELPDVPGVRERWGRDVLHCPYCHGWEVRDQAIGILATGPAALHQAMLFRQLTDDVTLFLHTAPPLTEAQREQLDARGIAVVEGEVAELIVTDDRLTGVCLASGIAVPRQALVVAPRFVARAGVLESLGLEPVEHPFGGNYIASDPTGLTAVPGVWVAGNVADVAAQVVGAASAGATAAAHINADLVAEDTRRAVATYHGSRPPAALGTRLNSGEPLDMDSLFTREFWDARYGSSEKIWSGNPNARLVEHVAGLTPGTALDVGSGEGADAIWLAARGWRVTGVDVSPVALERSAAQAAQAGPEIAERITWERADARVWDPAPRQFDLVSAQFMHLPRPALESLHRRLAAAVGPGGALLIVGHHASDLDTTIGRWKIPDTVFTAEQVAAVLQPDDWQILVSAACPREAIDPEGRTVTIHDAVLLARRR